MMKVLLLHNEDVPWRGPWASIDWELIIDLGFAPPSTYKMWSERCGTPVRSIHEFAGDGQSYASIPGILDVGRDRLAPALRRRNKSRRLTRERGGFTPNLDNQSWGRGVARMTRAGQGRRWPTAVRRASHPSLYPMWLR